jgi:hypothetical protein
VALFVVGAICERHQSILAHRPIMPGTVGGVGPPNVVYHGFKSCQVVPTPIWCQKFDHGLEFSLLVMVGGSTGPLLGLHPRPRVIARP